MLRDGKVKHYDSEILSIASQFPRVNVKDVDGIRAIFNEFLGASKDQSVPECSLVDYYDTSILGQAGQPDVPIRVYSPKVHKGQCPVFVNFHGGGFILGDLDSEHARCLKIAAECGSVVIGVDYRLAPEYPFPAGLLDCYAALEWVELNSSKLGIDASKKVIGGSSAGGCLTAAVALLARDMNGPSIALQMLFYPVLDDRCRTESMCQGYGSYVWNTQNCLDMWSHYLGENAQEVSPYAAPARMLDLSGLPPAYIMTCEHDPLRDEALEYATRLLKAGVSVELHNYPGTVHAFDLLIPATISTQALEEGVLAFKRATR